MSMTNPWIGRRQAVGIAVEATRGTPVNPTYWLNCLSFNFADKPTRALSEASFGGIWGGDQAPQTLIHAEGDFEVELGDQSFGAILKALFGTLVTTGPTDAAAYIHTYTLQNDNQHDSLSICTIDPIGQQMFALSMINTFELTIEPDAIVKYTVNFISKGSADWSGQNDSYGSEKKFVGRNLTFKMADTAAGLGAASAIKVKSLTLTIEKNAETQATLSTVQPEDIVNKRFNISGEVTLNYENRTYLNYVKDGDYKAIRIQLTHLDTITGCASTKYQFTLDLAKANLDAWEPDLAMDDIVTQKFNFTALYDAGVSDLLVYSCVLVNGVISY